MIATLHTTTGQAQQIELSSFKEIQNHLNGWVEIVTINGVDLAVDEEGLLKGLAPNPAFPDLVGNVISLPNGWDSLPFE